MTTYTTIAPIFSASLALIASGGIAALSLFDVPELQAQPASRSLPAVRWLFSRGSHIFPTAAFASCAGFIWSACASLPTAELRLGLITQLYQLKANGGKVNSFLLAAVLAGSIGPFTSLMIPTNFALIKLNEELGGHRSEKAFRENKDSVVAGTRSADDSVAGKGEGDQFMDTSSPQEETLRTSSKEEDEQARELIGRFGRLNMMRAMLLGAGGIVGLYAMEL